MARPRGDHDLRRREVSEAVWRVLVAHGFPGLTLRAVAAEMGATTGLVTHYFSGKRELVAHALDVLDERSAARARRDRGSGLPALRAVLLDMLPLTPDAERSNRVWVSSWDAALADPDLARRHARRYAESRERLRVVVGAAQLAGELPAADPDAVAAAVQSFVLGLAVQALLDPAAFPPDRQTALVDEHLALLARY